MNDRSQHLANQLTQQVRAFVSVLTGLTPARLNTPCRGEKDGDTIGVLVARATAIYDRTAAILGIVASGETTVRPGVRSVPNGRPGRPASAPAAIQTAMDAESLVKRLEERGSAASDCLRGLTAEQLSRALPFGAEVFEHVDKPVGMIIEYLIYCQADRYELIRQAITGPSSAQARPWSSAKPVVRRHERTRQEAGSPSRSLPAVASGKGERL